MNLSSKIVEISIEISKKVRFQCFFRLNDEIKVKF